MAHTDPHAHHGPEEYVGHETTDADLGSAEKIMIFTGLFLAASFMVVWLVQGSLQDRAAAVDVKPSPVVPRQGDRLPPLPRLQTTPNEEMQAFRATESAVVDGWAWVDRNAGIAQIPVSRAIEILAEQGLPVPATAPAAAPPAVPAAPAVPIKP